MNYREKNIPPFRAFAGITVSALPLVPALLLIGCSDGTTSSASPSAQDSTVPKRLKTLSVDLDRDGSINEVWTYQYDAAGRITTHEITDIDDPGRSRSLSFIYDGDELVSRDYSDGRQDIFDYEAGRLVYANLHTSGEHVYRYDDTGRLVGATGSDFSNDCDTDSHLDSDVVTQPPEYLIAYADDRLISVTASDDSYRLDITYTALQSFDTITEFCGDVEDSFDQLRFDYNAAGKLQTLWEVSVNAFIDFEWIESVTSYRYDDKGRVSGITETDDIGTRTTTTTHTPDGYPLTEDVVNTEQTSPYFSRLDYSLSYDYEDASCRTAYSANPVSLLLLDSVIPPGTRGSPLACLYLVDQGAF